MLPRPQVADDDTSMPAMDEVMRGGWFTNLNTGRYMGALPVGAGIHCGQVHGSTFAGWTAQSKLVLIQFPEQ